MNEVTVLSKLGEETGRVVGTGVRAARRGSVKLSQSGAVAGLGAAKMTVKAAQGAAAKRAERRLRQTGEAGRELVARVSLPELSLPELLDVAEVRAGLARRIDPPKKRRRWPLVAVLLVGGAAAAAVVASRRPVAPPPADAPPSVRTLNGTTAPSAAPAGTNGAPEGAGRTTE
ncbi:hypothetical protein [Rhodococcus sp. X156]|uniref:hypothetical protein n=1 Tax=Rhodococcus sp. X156 TaxID=2499145 RepID=UPI000FD73E7E|nr:hypothetical protein [Rhodococcus sp. X156]